jgi:GT2 family glycosyltransferase
MGWPSVQVDRKGLSMQRIGVVVIGRNEGERLRDCLESLALCRAPVVYVDSGSTDGSPDLARQHGAEVVPLDMSGPFTAARARNAGFQRLEMLMPDVEFVQFVDGDCQIAPEWFERAMAEMQQRPDVALFCGRRRERYPQHSVYNRLCDAEWNTPIGEAEECGGDALVRVSAFRAVGGYNPAVIAGEDSEMCMRLRRGGWKLWRIDAEMTRHDAAITQFAQWWRRTVRSGHALAERAVLHGGSPLRDCVRQRRSTLFWGAAVPLLWAALLTQSLVWPNLLALGYPLLAWRVFRYRRRRGDSPPDALVYAVATVLGKFAQLKGLLLYYLNRLRGRRTAIIEYKAPVGSRPDAVLSRGCV